ncbi:MAG: sulfatase [Planctomycetes bacterium]|nr:sulfatase [Planctomycetota bacterium]
MHRHRGTITASLLASVAALGAGCSEEPPPRLPTRPVGKPVNVLIVSLDTTRADRLGPYGRTTAKTPRLDALAAEGTTFESAFTPIPSTFPSHSTLFTGRYPQSHGVHDNAVYVLGSEQVTLAELLQAKGYATGAFVSAFVLDAQFGLDQGFATYDDEVDTPLMKFDVSKLPKDLPDARKKWEATIATAYQRRGDSTTQRALEWLGGLGAEPFFLWVHYFDAHQPYQPPPPWDRHFDPSYRGPMDGDQRKFWPLYKRGQITAADRDHMTALYDGEIAWQDECLGRLLDGLRKVGRFDETLIVVVADHGEALGEHSQIYEHNSEVYDEVMRVPLVVRRPDLSARGERVKPLVRTLDVAPTVLEWLGMAPEPAMQGQSLLPFTDADGERRAAAEGPGSILLEALRERQVNPTPRSLVALRSDRWKAIVTLDAQGEALRTELYDLERDPFEKRDLAATEPERADQLRAQVLRQLKELPKASGNARELGELDNEALRALGYAGD